MLGLANVCELAGINKNVWMDILGGRMGNMLGKNPFNFITEQEKIFYGDPWASGLQSVKLNCSHFISNVLMYVFD